MLILTIRTDRPEAELSLYKDGQKVAHYEWLAHRQLADTIHIKIKELLESRQLGLKDLEGLVVFKGPGSFTGLRIGISIANALADALGIPIVASSGEDWQETGRRRLEASENEKIVLPEYGAAPNITKPRK